MSHTLTVVRFLGLIRSICALLALAAVAPVTASAAGGSSVSEYEVKAAFLTNLVKFVEWPSHPSGRITLCILGEDPFGAALRGTEDIGGGRLLFFQRVATLGDAGDCQVLFLPRKERPSIPAVLATLKGREVLTVGDGEGMAAEGLALSFLKESQRVRFDVNLDAIRGSGLTVSPKVLGLARTVHQQR